MNLDIFNGLFSDTAFIVGALLALLFLGLFIAGIVFFMKGIKEQKRYNTTALPSLEEEEKQEEEEQEFSAFDIDAMLESNEYDESESDVLLSAIHKDQGWSERKEKLESHEEDEDSIDINDFIENNENKGTGKTSLPDF